MMSHAQNGAITEIDKCMVDVLLFNEQRKASSIISTDPLEAEILSTVWMIANKEQQQLLTENFKDIQATLYDL